MGRGPAPRRPGGHIQLRRAHHFRWDQANPNRHLTSPQQGPCPKGGHISNRGWRHSPWATQFHQDPLCASTRHGSDRRGGWGMSMSFHFSCARRPPPDPSQDSPFKLCGPLRPHLRLEPWQEVSDAISHMCGHTRITIIVGQRRATCVSSFGQHRPRVGRAWSRSGQWVPKPNRPRLAGRRMECTSKARARCKQERSLREPFELLRLSGALAPIDGGGLLDDGRRGTRVR